MTAPAGWYNDPAGSGGQRYFDGLDWTSHYAPPPQPVFQSPYVVVNRGSDHTFHLLMTLFTCGLWAPVWIVMEIVSASKGR
jgi:hypothetical protein